MKVIFYGLGSIGRKHVKNLSRVCSELGVPLELHAYRSSDKPLHEDVQMLIHQEIFVEAELDHDYDIAFITNPTAYHYEAISVMVNKCKHMFIEKPLFDTLDQAIEDIPWQEGGVYYVAAPLRYTGVVQAMQSIVATESIYSVRVICSSYLPDWRPGVDYREVYSAKTSEGGGVRVDLIHEWDYLTHLFGFPERVLQVSGQYSHLEIDSEDLAAYIGVYKDKLIEVHLDYFGRAPQRKIELFTRDRLITGDFLARQIHYSNHNEAIEASSSSTDMYMEEMRYFMNLVLDPDNRNRNSNLEHVRHAYEVLKLVKGGVQA